MKVGELKALLRDIPNDAVIKVCDTSGEEQALLEIDDVGWVQERGCYVLWAEVGGD